MSSEKKVSMWAKAVSEHMKSGGHFPKKGSADYDAVMKIKERLSGDKATVAPAAMKEMAKKTTKTPKARQSELSHELERLGTEISNLKKKYSEPAGEPSPHDRIPDAVEMLTSVIPKARKARKPSAPKKVAESLPAGSQTKGSDVGHTVEVVAEKGHPALSIAHTIPLGRLASVVQHSKLPFQ